MIKTRFAPSPTGYIHLGNLRSAIYPYLIAKQQGGTFILRIEDTDRARYVEGATDLIKETLLWLGLTWDEGPDKGGPNAPYFQSERVELYHEYAKKLIEKGRAYADPTPAETIAKYREEDVKSKRAFLYRNHRPENTPDWEPGIPLRFKSEPKARKWHDEVMGDLESGPEVEDDIILIKADGLPTYNFAHIVDDAEMGVTHVVRGVEYLSSMGNYLSLYEALDITPPKFVSLPHILATTGNKKLSKRDGAKSATDYRDLGVLPEALLNYLACLGWNDGTEQEIYDKSQLLEAFSIDRIQKSGARFDETKLLWYSGQWIRKLADEQGIDALFERSAPFWPENTEPDTYKKQILSIIYDRLKTLGDLKSMTAYFFSDPKIDLSMLTENKFLKNFSEKELIDLLEVSDAQLASDQDWTPDSLQNTLNALLDKTGKKPAELFSLIRIALSFAPFSPALNLTLNVLGRERSLARLSAVKTALTYEQN